MRERQASAGGHRAVRRRCSTRMAPHAATRAHGREHWYDHYDSRVATVERAYGSKPAA